MLESIQSSSYSLITSSRFWMILLAIIFFLFIAVYVYNKYVYSIIQPTYLANTEFPTESVDNSQSGHNAKEAEMMIFTVDWCPHSKKAIPIWNEIKEEYNNKVYNGYKLVFSEINGEDNPSMADKYKVDGYPTIKLLKDNQVIEYDAKPSVTHLKEFLNSTLNLA